MDTRAGVLPVQLALQKTALLMSGGPMLKVGTDEKIYPLTKIALVVDALKEAGVAPAEALRGSHVSALELTSAATRVSLNQVLEVYRNALRLAPQPYFAYRTGLRFHVTTYGMYGFAILSSTNFRQTMQFAMQYHQLATPLADVFFKEQEGKGVWTIAPLAHPAVDARLYQFLVELQFGHNVSLHRDVMGGAFTPSEVHVTFAKPISGEPNVEPLGCKILYQQPENRMIFDANWLDGDALLGNPITYSAIADLCHALLEELHLRTGLAGQIRQVLLTNLGHDTSLAAVSARLNIPERTLRRRLLLEGTSFRAIADELRAHLATKDLRDTDLSVEDIAFALGFSDAANFRHAFRRWTNKSPNELRNRAGIRRTD